MNRERFRFFATTFRESDLWIGVPHSVYHPEMQAVAQKELQRLREILDAYIKAHPEFATSLEALPLPAEPATIPEEIRIMLDCGLQSRTGPMSAVAGLFAEYVGNILVGEYGLEEVVVENGGDLFLKNSSVLNSVIHAGASPLSDKMAFSVPPGIRGICTSSGTMGHSLSFGKADAVTVISHSTPLADAWATSLANRVQRPADLEEVLDLVSELPDIQACAIIAGDQIGLRGEIELKLLT
jgi:ApbE superfamily uncharacterized protein (UPF0280 family)